MSNSSQTPDRRSQPPRRRAPLVAVAALAGFAALAALAAAPRSDPAPVFSATAEREIEIVATEFALQAPDSVTAGRVRLRLANRGREMHVLEIARLEDGHTAEELAEHLAARRPTPEWATFVGGPLAPPPGPPSADLTADEGGADLEVTMDLEPGRYALICPIPSPHDHRPHMVKGMARTLVVTPRAVPMARPESEPLASRGGADRAGTARVVLDDYGFIMEPEWRAGRQVVRVENRAAQPHEIVVFRLDPGKRVADVLSWASSLTGPPPGTLVAGATAISRGRVVTLDLTLAPGNYALLCFVPDAKDGRSHVQHGMTREVTVR